MGHKCFKKYKKPAYLAFAKIPKAIHFIFFSPKIFKFNTF